MDDLLVVKLARIEKGELLAGFWRVKGNVIEPVSVPVCSPQLVARDIVSYLLHNRVTTYIMRGKIVSKTALRRNVTIIADPRPKGAAWAKAIIGV